MVNYFDNQWFSFIFLCTSETFASSRVLGFYLSFIIYKCLVCIFAWRVFEFWTVGETKEKFWRCQFGLWEIVMNFFVILSFDIYRVVCHPLKCQVNICSGSFQSYSLALWPEEACLWSLIIKTLWAGRDGASIRASHIRKTHTHCARGLTPRHRSPAPALFVPSNCEMRYIYIFYPCNWFC